MGYNIEMKNDKYKLTKETMEVFGETLYRIEALKDFGNVSKGDKGGYIKAEANLSVSGDAWVSGNAGVSGDACVSGNASVSGNAGVYGDASVSGNAWVSGNARVYGNAWVSGDAWVSGNARVYGNASVSGKFSLTAGYFFGMKYHNEEIKTFKTADNEEILYKGDDAKIEPSEPETPSLKGKEVEVKLDGVTYKAIIQ